MSAKPKLAHVVLQTGQPQVMREWYCTVLDGSVVYEDDALCFITFDEEHHRVALLSPQQHVAVEKVVELLERVGHVYRAWGDDVDVLPGSGRQLRRDADRQLRHPRRGHQLHARRRVRGRFGGPAFDPETMLAERRGGAPVEELIGRSWSLKADLAHPMSVLTASS